MNSARTPHPILIVAALSVIILSLTGIAAMMGWLPTSRSEPDVTASAKPDQQRADAEAKAKQAAETQQPAQAKPARPREPRRIAAGETKNEAAKPGDKPAARICPNCGVVESVNVVEVEGEGTGLGAIAGGVAGGILGHQIGQGRGNTVATIAGVAGGAYAGHEVEKRVKKTKRYDIQVRMDDGTTRLIQQQTDPALGIGQKVRIENGAIVAE